MNTISRRTQRTFGLTRTVRRLILLLCALLLLNSCSEEEPKVVRDTQFALGTTCTVQLYGTEYRSLIEPVFELIEDVESKMSVRKEGTEAWEINEMAGREPVAVSEETFTVIRRAKEYSALSDGTFDLSIEPLVELWGIGSEAQRIPGDEEISTALEKVDYRKVELDAEASSVFLEEPGMGIDLGGIAKGWAADKAVDYLLSEGVSFGIVNFGGNVYAFGSKYDAEPWKIGIQAPDEERGSYVGIAEVRDKAVVTSGKYERYFVEDGIRYHHILSTEDGRPLRNDLASVTVITERSLDADALSTLLFTLGLEKGIRRAEDLDNTEAIFFTEDKTVFTTSGLRESFRITGDTYKRGESRIMLEE